MIDLNRSRNPAVCTCAGGFRAAFLLNVLTAGCSVLVATGQATAQALVNSDGAYPSGGLVLSSNILYGTATSGGSSSYGAVFALNIDGSGFKNLHSLTYDDGAFASGDLTLSGNILYGTATSGGSSGYGTVFSLNADGTGFTNLHSFNETSDGSSPQGLVLSGTTLYGTAQNSGISDGGTVFALNTDGTGFVDLHSFAAPISLGGTNSEGSSPQALILSSNRLYGTASGGGSLGGGTVFAIGADGKGFTNLHGFTATGANSSGVLTNSDGALPQGLVLMGDVLYGTASGGGSSGVGTLFKVNTDGTGFTNLHSFVSSIDGALPQGLILVGDTLYGTAGGGGNLSVGTVFKVKTDGTGFTNLHSFSSSDGAYPHGGLVFLDNTLYGTATSGGGWGYGTVFALSIDGTSFTNLYSFTPLSGLVPQLTFSLAETNVVLTWDVIDGAYTLQSTTNLVSPRTWLAAFPAPTVVNGRNAVTNSISGTQRFYRLVSQMFPGSCIRDSDCPCGRCVIPFGGSIGNCSANGPSCGEW